MQTLCVWRLSIYRVCSVYLVMTAARLLQSVSTAVSAAGDCMGRATQLLAGARELTATARNENPSRDQTKFTE